jgi:hypothetical protein
MPPGSNLTSVPGPATLFDDDRIRWAEKSAGGFTNKKILELGPLEAGHSYMSQQAGAGSIIAIEANTRAYLKCLCIKELFDLNRVHFKLGDFNAFLDAEQQRYDTLIASGVLYHMTDPVSTLARFAKVSDQLFIWTHYYDREIIESVANFKSQFDAPHTIPLKNFDGTGARRFYGQSLGWSGFCGGSEPFAIWLSKPTILARLSHT